MNQDPLSGKRWAPGASLQMLRRRAALLREIRTFFNERGVLEVETPVLSAAGNSDPGIRQWRTAGEAAWLRTSPEYAMKRLLAAGGGDIYELGRVFRAAEDGRHHNREFTMLEWYRVGWGYHELMDEVVQLLRDCWPGETLSESRHSYRELFQEHAQIDPFDAELDELRSRLASAGVQLDAPDRAECLDLLLSAVIQPRLPERQLTFVYDFPADQAALARIRPGSPDVAERFELFLGPVELANGYQELTDPEEQLRRFERENQAREKAGQATVPLDTMLIDALTEGLPRCSGVALGVDRMLMVMTGAASLSEVMTFSADQS